DPNFGSVQPELFYADSTFANRVWFRPEILSSGSATAYLFDTSNVLTNGDKLLSIGNAGAFRMGVQHTGGITIGPNTESDHGAAEFGESLVSVRDVAAGEPNLNQIFIKTKNGANDT